MGFLKKGEHQPTPSTNVATPPILWEGTKRENVAQRSFFSLPLLGEVATQSFLYKSAPACGGSGSRAGKGGVVIISTHPVN